MKRFFVVLALSGVIFPAYADHMVIKEGNINEVLPYVEGKNVISTEKLPVKHWFYDPYENQKYCLTDAQAQARRIPVDSAEKPCTEAAPPQ